MFKIKGPIEFNAKSGNLPSKIVDAVKPIVAKNLGFDVEEEPELISEEEVEEEEPLDLEELSFKELREEAKKYGVKGRSRKELIREILEVSEGEE